MASIPAVPGRMLVIEPGLRGAAHADCDHDAQREFERVHGEYNIGWELERYEHLMRGVTPPPGRRQCDRPGRAHQRVPSPYESRNGDGFYGEREDGWSDGDENASEFDIDNILAETDAYTMLGMDGTGPECWDHDFAGRLVPRPRHVEPADPRCRRCHRSDRVEQRTTSASNARNPGRKFWNCARCSSTSGFGGFTCWVDGDGINPANPLCFCGQRSRLVETTDPGFPGRSFYGCNMRHCDFMQFIQDIY